MELHEEISDAILDLCLFADQRGDISPEMRRLVDRLRDLRARIDEGDWMFPDFDFAEGEPE